MMAVLRDIRKFLLCSISGLLLQSSFLALPAYAQVSFPVSFSSSAAGLTQNERDQLTLHFQAAGQQWVQMLGLTEIRSIEILIGVDDIPRANGRSDTSVFFGVFGTRNTFEQSAAYELRTGIDPNGSTADILINFGLDYLRNELWFDADPENRTGPVPASKTDAMSVFLHELGHAWAYNGWSNGAGIPPAQYWSTFDRWMQGSSPTLFHGPAAMTAWGDAPELTTNNINHWGNAPGLDLNLDHDNPQFSEPVQWRDGVPVPRNTCPGPISVDQPENLAELVAANDLLAELMNGVVFHRGMRYYISPLDIAALKDAGLSFDTENIFLNGFEN